MAPPVSDGDVGASAPAWGWSALLKYGRNPSLTQSRMEPSEGNPNTEPCQFLVLRCRYGYEALLDNEFHGAEGFFFTPYSQKVCTALAGRSRVQDFELRPFAVSNRQS